MNTVWRSIENWRHFYFTIIPFLYSTWFQKQEKMKKSNLQSKDGLKSFLFSRIQTFVMYYFEFQLFWVEGAFVEKREQCGYGRCATNLASKISHWFVNEPLYLLFTFKFPYLAKYLLDNHLFHGHVHYLSYHIDKLWTCHAIHKIPFTNVSNSDKNVKAAIIFWPILCPNKLQLQARAILNPPSPVFSPKLNVMCFNAEEYTGWL